MLHVAGFCSAAGYSSCCVSGPCKGEPPNCYCDHLCHIFKDCCPDANILCHFNKISGIVISNHSLYSSSERARYLAFWVHNKHIIVYLPIWLAGSITLNFVIRPNSITSSLSRRAEFLCSVRSTIIPSFTWQFTQKGASNAVTLANGTDSSSADYSIISGHKGQILAISNVQWRHGGVYTCIVSSVSSQIQAEANLNVLSEYILLCDLCPSWLYYNSTVSSL